MWKTLVLLPLTFGVCAGVASAANVYDTTSGTITDRTTPFAGNRLDDVTLSTGPATIRSINFAFHNITGTAEDVDAIVTIWDTANTNAAGQSVVNSGLLGSFTTHIGTIGGNSFGSTGLLNLPTPIVIPDANASVEIDFVLHSNSSISDVVAGLSSVLPTTGSTADKFWDDSADQDGVFQGSEQVSGSGSIHANLFLALNTAAVPEPSSAALMAVAVFCLLARRRAQRPRMRMEQSHIRTIMNWAAL